MGCIKYHSFHTCLNLTPSVIVLPYAVSNQFRLYWKCRWKLVETDGDLSKLDFETKHVMSLINPADTYMVARLFL